MLVIVGLHTRLHPPPPPSLVCVCVCVQAPLMSTYKDLAEDENLELTYEMRPNPLYNSQITAAVVFNNLSDRQLVSIEFNVLDSLNTKLERPVSSDTYSLTHSHTHTHTHTHIQ